MKKSFFVAGYLLFVTGSLAQTVNQKLQQAIHQFENDAQLKHAISSLYVIDAKTGKVVFDKNSQIGLAPASTQKIITAVTAFESLGKDYKYKTELGYDGTIQNGLLNGRIIIIGRGDPTLGSWRYSSTNDTVLLQKWVNGILKLNIHGFDEIEYDESKYSLQNTPDGWIWQDMGNYYGAGTFQLNWRENQYDLILRSGDSIGSDVEIVSPKLRDRNKTYYNNLKSAEKGSGDNAYVYLNNDYSLLSGTIPRGEKNFNISASVNNPSHRIMQELSDRLLQKRIRPALNREFSRLTGVTSKAASSFYKILDSHYSPSLDSIIYWFLKKSINLYGEALIKTFAYEKKGFGSTDSGVVIVKNFWKQKGIDEDELNISDGSGLSPQNRVTTHAQVEILKYAKTRDWFPYFYNSLPEYNGMVMKSGTIKDVKGFCGYHKAKDGKEYIFSFLVNNYNGPASGLVNKMYKVLDTLK